METVENQASDVKSGSVPATMRAWVQERYGTSEVFDLVDLPVPEVEGKQVLIEVHASSVNAADWHIGTGYPSFVRLQMGLRTPKRKTPGGDAAGVVVAMGPEATRFALGDRVVGNIPGGGFAEYAISNEANLVAFPETVGFAEAGALPIAGLTAIQALRTHGGVQPGQRVLINGASGGVGTFAVQIAKILGAEVTAVCSTGNVQQARDLGADHVVDYKTQSFSDVGAGFDVILDLASSQPIKVMKSILALSGTYLYIGGPKGNMPTWAARFARAKLAFRKGDQKLAVFTAEANDQDMSDLVSWVADGSLTPAIQRTHSLEEAMEAFDHLAAGHAKGKLVITVH